MTIGYPHLPMVRDDGIHVALRVKVWCVGGDAFIQKQQQGLMGVLGHGRHDWDE